MNQHPQKGFLGFVKRNKVPILIITLAALFSCLAVVGIVLLILYITSEDTPLDVFIKRHTKVNIPRTKSELDGRPDGDLEAIFAAVEKLGDFYYSDLKAAFKNADGASLTNLQNIFEQLEELFDLYDQPFVESFDNALIKTFNKILGCNYSPEGLDKKNLEFTTEESSPVFDKFDRMIRESIEDQFNTAVKKKWISTNIKDLRIIYYHLFYDVSIKWLFRTKYAKEDIRRVVRDILENYANRGFAECGIRSTLREPVDFNQTETEVIRQFDYYYISSEQNLALDECASSNKPRPAIRNDCSCYAIAAFQCLATFYPLITKFIKPLTSEEAHPARLQLLLEALGEFEKQTMEPFKLRDRIRYKDWGEPLKVVKRFFENTKFWPYLQVYRLIGNIPPFLFIILILVI